MKQYILLLFILNGFVCFGQQNGDSNNDISEKELNTISSYRNKIIQYINPNPDSAIFYANKIKTFSRKLNYNKGIVDGDYMLGQCQKRLQQNDSAIAYFEKSLNLSHMINYEKGKARAFNSIGRTYYLLGKMDASIDACKKAIELTQKFNDEGNLILADSHLALATAYARQNQMEDALINLLVIDSIHNTSNLRPDVIAAAYQNMGNIYLELNNYDFSERYYLMANKEFLKLPQQSAKYYLNTTNINLGRVYFHKNNLRLADSLLSSSLEYYTLVNDERTKSEILNYLGQVKLEKNELDTAEKLFEQSYSIHKNNERHYEASLSALQIAKLSLEQNNPTTAFNYLNEIEALNQIAYNSKVDIERIELLSKAHMQSGNYSKAYNYIEKANHIKDSLREIQSAEKIKELESIYTTERKDKEIALLKSENELNEQKQKSQRNILIGGLGLTTLAGLFLFFLYKNRQKTNSKLKELDTVKSDFFANISHEFRTPLTLINLPIEDALEDESLSEDKKLKFSIAKRNSDRLLSLVNQLLDLSKIDDGKLKLQIQKGNITQLISALSESCTYRASHKNIDFNVSIKPLKTDVYYDKDALEKIVTNLMSNAIKYTPRDGKIDFNVDVKNDELHFEIKNTGRGISKEELKQIFQRFYQTSEQNQGTGIGLALVKELVELHKGTIDVKSIPNELTTFTVSLPVDKNSFKDEDFINYQIQESHSAQIADQSFAEDDSEFTQDDQPILLIVEDNADVRHILKDTFKDTYNIITASNGEEGISVALKHIPDIIISDIMMPVKDGVALTEELKNSELTSHIPIILLTAKAGDENKLIGVETGADDYITKPFSSKILIAKVAKLIELRENLQKRYSQEIILRPKDIAVTDLDEQFMEKVQFVLDEKLVEPSFSVEDFSNTVGMSRMQLHRKLKALTGLSASEFIRSQRLKLAAKLLKTSDINISQVGYSVGFNDHSYFAKCFKETYNCTPSEYANRK